MTVHLIIAYIIFDVSFFKSSRSLSLSSDQSSGKSFLLLATRTAQSVLPAMAAAIICDGSMYPIAGVAPVAR